MIDNRPPLRYHIAVVLGQNKKYLCLALPDRPCKIFPILPTQNFLFLIKLTKNEIQGNNILTQYSITFYLRDARNFIIFCYLHPTTTTYNGNYVIYECGNNRNKFEWGLFLLKPKKYDNKIKRFSDRPTPIFLSCNAKQRCYFIWP